MKIIKRPVVLMAEEKTEWLEHIARLGDPEKVFFMDIETTGFSRTYDSVYLTGFLYYEGGQFFLEQHLASDLRDEPELIDAFCDRLSDAESVVTFNGDMFDFHNNPTIIYIKWEDYETEFSTSIHIINVNVGISLSIL